MPNAPFSQSLSQIITLHLDIIFLDCRYIVVQAHPCSEGFSHPNNFFYHFRTSFFRPLTFLVLVGGIGGSGGIKMASASTPSANEPAKDLTMQYS